MRAILFVLLASIAAGKVVLNFDKNDEGRVDILKKEEAILDNLHFAAEFSTAESRDPAPGIAALDARALVSPTNDLDALVDKRQVYCNTGYGYCPKIGICCPSGPHCCGYGYCIDSGSACCPSGPCGPGNGCCGVAHCYPLGGECCNGETHCKPGNHCYITRGRQVCCTNSACTASVDDKGTTSYATASTTTYTITTTRVRYYYWTITWWYYYYYWTWSIEIDASIVTSSRSTTTTIFSVKTTDADAASSYFEGISETLTLPTPAEATSLESLAGSTSFLREPSRTSAEAAPEETSTDEPPTTTERETQSSSPSPPEEEETESDDPSTSTSAESEAQSSRNPRPPKEEETETEDLSPPTTTERETQSDTSSRPENEDGNGSTGGSGNVPPQSAASALWSGLDTFTVAFFSIAMATGILAFAL